MQVNISYQTLHLPPPYAYAYTLNLDFRPEGLKVNFDLEYLNRETLSEEEIQNEGYSSNDNFQWSGLLDPVWNDELRDIAHVKLQKETEEEINTWIHFELSNKNSGIVDNPDEWEYRLQELIQAIYETSGYEKPLQMKFIHQEKGQRTYYELKGSFATRSCLINKNHISWQQMQTLMSEVFTMDFDGEATPNPQEDSLWIDPNGFSGYQAVSSMAGKNSEKLSKKILAILTNNH